MAFRTTGTCLSRKQLTIVRDAVEFFADRLGISRRVKLWVSVRHNIPMGWYGVTYYHNKVSKGFNVHVRYSDMLTMLLTLAHEMTHVWQLSSKRWVHQRDDIAYFQEREYEIEKVAYTHQPWEKEARIMEAVLVREYNTRMKERGIVLF